MIDVRAAPKVETVTTEEGLAALAARGWDDLVRSMPRPSPFLLHGWLLEWWLHFGEGGELRVHVATGADGTLAGALPLFVQERLGTRIAQFVGGVESVLADLLLRDGAGGAVAAELASRAVGGDHHLVDLFGLSRANRLLPLLGEERFAVIERIEAPVLDISAGWDEVYRAKTHSKKRNLHARRRRQLAELGRLETHVARTADELEAALEDAFRLHALRWAGRPDSSDFAAPDRRRFAVAAYRALAADGVPRIVTLRLDGRAIAFHAYFALCGSMYVHRLAFDPALSRFSPGLVNTLDALEAASAEGLTRVEFLGGGERYKLELADGIEPLYQAIGLPRTLAARAVASARAGAIRLRLRLKRSDRLMRLYYRGLPRLRRRRQESSTRA